MAESDPPELLPNPPSPPSLPPQPDPPNTSPPQLPSDSLGKRQRRPSVRLGEIGHQPFSDPNATRSTKHPSRLPNYHSSKNRPLTNLVQNGAEPDSLETLDADHRNLSGEGQSEFPTRRMNTKKGTVRRARTNLSSKMEHDAFETGSESPLKDLTPVHSVEKETLNIWNRRMVRARVSDNELENMPETDSRDRKCDSSADGVKDWLIGLGLGRYAPVFEIHEVDDEVLPLLTLDDLKDMGINAVGSRRKMYTAIQKLRKGFS